VSSPEDNGKKSDYSETRDVVTGRFGVGNPGGPGRPRKKPISAASEKLLEEQVPDSIVRGAPELKGKTWAEAIVFGQALEAVKGRTPAADFVADHGEGKVAQPFTGEDGTPLFEDSESIARRAMEILESARARLMP
jgi:hypothetical protein